jgi:ABC-type transport system involved in cytochrome bd biosynthesis fused ATPase/permease subunit
MTRSFSDFILWKLTRAVREQTLDFLPDPVDLFDDTLAERLGLHRPDGVDEETWRLFRAAFIRDHPDADRVSELVMQFFELDPELLP